MMARECQQPQRRNHDDGERVQGPMGRIRKIIISANNYIALL
ncbi:MAG: hypothetical protein ACK56F_07110 [bacterium]